MELKVYSIRDSKGEVFNQPWFSRSHGEAERHFTLLTQDEKSLLSKYPEDFDLYYLGTYNDQTGLIKSLDTPQHLIKAVQTKIQ